MGRWNQPCCLYKSHSQATYHRQSGKVSYNSGILAFKMTIDIVLQEFIMKAHIFAGAVRLKKKYCSDFIWVTQDEMERMIDSRTLKAIRPLLAER
jgi:hypothetical protein